jgi:N-acetylglucosaminyldiphosphoundecaprenol N-acetyl-beta-D-mannosaminyltransferase
MSDEIFNTSILGIRVDLINQDELIGYIINTILGRKRAICANVNVHAINLAQKESWFKEFINHSDVVFCDGFGVKWAASFLNAKDLTRLTPPDWFDLLAEKCAQQGISMFFLGTHQEVIEKARALAVKKHPDLDINGIQHGYFDKSRGSAENQKVVETLNSLQPDILIVGFGMPAQEKWIMENWEDLHVCVVIPVGAFFDYYTGETIRAPKWMTDHGLEWLGRLIIEPGRLWKRYIIGNPIFLWRVFLQKCNIFK